eukprot:10943204-Alexandrium_andersonii.AAC.1
MSGEAFRGLGLDRFCLPFRKVGLMPPRGLGGGSVPTLIWNRRFRLFEFGPPARALVTPTE